MPPQDDIELHAKADTMNTDLEIITLREAKQTALEVRPAIHPICLHLCITLKENMHFRLFYS